MVEPEPRLVAGGEVVRAELHMRLYTGQDCVKVVGRRAMSCEGQDIQAVIPLTDINEMTREEGENAIAYRKAEYLSIQVANQTSDMLQYQNLMSLELGDLERKHWGRTAFAVKQQR